MDPLKSRLPTDQPAVRIKSDRADSPELGKSKRLKTIRESTTGLMARTPSGNAGAAAAASGTLAPRRGLVPGETPGTQQPASVLRPGGMGIEAPALPPTANSLPSDLPLQKFGHFDVHPERTDPDDPLLQIGRNESNDNRDNKGLARHVRTLEKNRHAAQDLHYEYFVSDQVCKSYNDPLRLGRPASPARETAQARARKMEPMLVDVPVGYALNRVIGQVGFGGAPLAGSDFAKLKEQLATAPRGTIISDPGLMSTSTGDTVHHEFVDEESADEAYDIKFRLTAGPGVMGMPILHDSGSKKLEAPLELTFAPGQRMALQNVAWEEGRQGGKLLVDAVLLAPTPDIVERRAALQPELALLRQASDDWSDQGSPKSAT